MVVMLDSVETIYAKYVGEMVRLKWPLTGLFTFEYLVRLASVLRPTSYAMSFFDVVDFLAIITTYVSLLVSGVLAALACIS